MLGISPIEAHTEKLYDVYEELNIMVCVSFVGCTFKTQFLTIIVFDCKLLERLQRINSNHFL